MVYHPDLHHRRSIRLQGYDYATPGAYYVTLCVQERACLYGEVDAGVLVMNPAGRMVAEVWRELPGRYPRVALDAFVVMPNHFHGIVLIGEPETGSSKSAIGDGRGESRIRPPCGKHGPRVGVDHGRTGYNGDKGDHKERGGHTDKGDHKDRPYGTEQNSLGRVIQAFKSLTTRAYIDGVAFQGWPPFPGRLWQRNYFERVLRGQAELDAVRRYMDENPGRWASDPDNPEMYP